MCCSSSKARAQRGVFIGDVWHHLLQVYYPDWNFPKNSDADAGARQPAQGTRLLRVERRAGVSRPRRHAVRRPHRKDRGRLPAGLQGLSRIIAFSRCGVTGNCVTAPGRRSASSMAEAIAAPTGLVPPSPAPLRPSGLSGLGASSVTRTRKLGHFARGRHQIIGEGDRERLAVLVVEEFLQQRAADALRQAAGDLAFDQLRVDRLADVVGDRHSARWSRRRCRRSTARPPRRARRRDRPCASDSKVSSARQAGRRARARARRAASKAAGAPVRTISPFDDVELHPRCVCISSAAARAPCRAA